MFCLWSFQVTAIFLITESKQCQQHTLNDETCIILSNGNAGWIVHRFVFKTLCSQFMGKVTNS